MMLEPKNIKDDIMTYFLYQTALISCIAIFAGSIIGWWLHYFYGKEQRDVKSSELTLVKDYLAESIRENARIKLQLNQAEEKIQTLCDDKTPKIDGVDFEAYQAFENTVKEAQLRKYLN